MVAVGSALDVNEARFFNWFICSMFLFLIWIIIIKLQPHYNTVVYSTNSVITRLRLGSHCLYFLCIIPSL